MRKSCLRLKEMFRKKITNKTGFVEVSEFIAALSRFDGENICADFSCFVFR